MFLGGLITWMIGMVIANNAFDLSIGQHFGIGFITLGMVAMGWSGNDV